MNTKLTKTINAIIFIAAIFAIAAMINLNYLYAEFSQIAPENYCQESICALSLLSSTYFKVFSYIVLILLFAKRLFIKSIARTLIINTLTLFVFLSLALVAFYSYTNLIVNEGTLISGIF